MSETIIRELLADTGDLPAAIVLREYLLPVEGPDGIFFPPTFAPAEDLKKFGGGYNIDKLNESGTENICLVDSVGSQANRIEPMFAQAPYASLVPQVVIEAGEKRVNLLDVGHRAGDALVRCTPLQEELNAAFKALKSGNAVPMAKLAPTSLIFGVWDSRDTQVKAPRLLAATIRAFNVTQVWRSATYVPPVEYVADKHLPGFEEEADSKLRSNQGFQHALASHTHGGVIARGDIRRDVTLQLAALRLLRGTTSEETERLRAYLLGLALLAFTWPGIGYLRQGCNLVLDAGRPALPQQVFNSGRRTELAINHADALRFATGAALAFGMGDSRSVAFSSQMAASTLDEAKKRSNDKGAKKGKEQQ